jgi:benzoyl-CoA reductase/2-hydroxyglutaryl-CoA dehydratase subunit BcrC/BadD/HgdB
VNAVLYSSPYVPPEWIAAHGLRPCRRRPGRGRAAAAAGLCPFAGGFLREADEALADGSAAAVVVTTTCDQMRRGAETLPSRGAFLLNVPHAGGTPTAHRTYRDELLRLGRFLVSCGGSEPGHGELVAALRRFDDGRRAIRAARGRPGGRAFAEAVAAFDERGDGRFEAPDALPTGGGIRVALIGGPLREEDLVVHDLLEDAGARVVLDATETGERGLPAPFDRRRLAGDPILELADAYFGSIPDAFRRPNDALYRWLRAEIDDRGVQALVVVHCVWCDLWHAEVERLRGWAGLPLAEITLVDGDGGARRSIETRLQALVEVAS